MMSIEWENASAIREKLSGNASLEDLLVDAWQRIDELARRVNQLERAAFLRVRLRISHWCVTRRSSRLPMATWIMARETSSLAS